MLTNANFGSLGDLDADVAKVVWVTVYRACEMGFSVEQAGGQHALLENSLTGDGKLTLELEHWVLNLNFLKQMIPLIRGSVSDEQKRDGTELLIDCLKWGITDAVEMSDAERHAARTIARVDPFYLSELPQDVLVTSARP